MPRVKFKPHEYQKIAIEYVLMHPRCGLWLPMGMGKSSVVLTALDMLFSLKEETPPALIIAPLRVATTTWPEEVGKWEHLKNMIIQPIIGTEVERRVALRNRKAHIFTINYENIPWLVQTLGNKWPFKVIIADESSKLKSFRTRQGGKRAHALASVAWENVTRFVELSGTPASNGLKDVWGPLWFLDQGSRLCRTYTAFKQRFFNEDREHFKLELRPGAGEEIENKLKDICMSLNPKDYFDLREPIVSNRYIELPSEVRKKYKELEKEMFTELRDVFKESADRKADKGTHHGIEAVNAAARTMKCLQFASGCLYLDGDNKEWAEVHTLKLQALEEIVEEAAGMPVLVAYHFKSDLARLKKYFPQAKELDKDPKRIKMWNQGKIPVLLAHPASAGHGLNLQDGGNIIVFFSHDWSLENRMQILERIGPMRQLQSGYDRPVFIYNIIARATVDEMVIKRLEGKQSIQEILMEAMKHKQGE